MELQLRQDKYGGQPEGVVKPDDQRTMELILQVANTVDENLRFTMDCPRHCNVG